MDPSGPDPKQPDHSLEWRVGWRHAPQLLAGGEPGDLPERERQRPAVGRPHLREALVGGVAGPVTGVNEADAGVAGAEATGGDAG